MQPTLYEFGCIFCCPDSENIVDKDTIKWYSKIMSKDTKSIKRGSVP